MIGALGCLPGWDVLGTQFTREQSRAQVPRRRAAEKLQIAGHNGMVPLCGRGALHKTLASVAV